MCLLTPSTPLLRVNTLVIPRWIAIFCFCYGCRSKNIARIANAVQVTAATAGILIGAGSMGGAWLKSLPSAMPFETPVTGMVQVAL